MKQVIQRTLLVATILVVLVLTGALTAAAQHGYRVTKRVIFKSGQISTSVRGTIPNTLEGHEYVFRAREGQTMLVKLSSAKKEIGFFIQTPDGEMLDQETALRRWSGELPASGDYHLVINTLAQGAARYTLVILIASDI